MGSPRQVLVLLLAVCWCDVATAAPTWSGMDRSRDNGLASCRAVLQSFGRQPPPAGLRRCVIFDIDNTLVDTRKRTRAAGRSIGLRNIPLFRVGYDGLETAANLGLSAETTRRYDKRWSRFFWRPWNLKHDGRIDRTIRLARQAGGTSCQARAPRGEAGTDKLEVFYLTGRINRLKPKTIAQLRKLGLPNVDEAHVICKPSVLVPTAPFKRGVVTDLKKRYQIGWFMSDSRSDIAEVQKVLSPGRCVLVGFPVGPARQPAVHPLTPVIRVDPPRL